jgi:hypothetical protein
VAVGGSAKPVTTGTNTTTVLYDIPSGTSGTPTGWTATFSAAYTNNTVYVICANS